MNILFTNHRQNSFGGTQTIIRDLVLNLLARGHGAVAYSSDPPPPPGSSLADEGVPIVNRLDDLPFVPDVIHGQHNMDSMTAVMALPGIPAVYCCHGATRTDAQPRHPRIMRYTAMSASLKLRMAIESCIPEEMIEVVHNAVDLRRFRTVREPPARPRRALVYSRNVVEGSPLEAAIREAADRRGLEIVLGPTGFVSRAIKKPESGLLDYDLVFASGKSAIDALACGCAVIVLGGAASGFAATGCGEMVTTANFERLRLANFAAPFNSPSPTASEVGAQIDRYEVRDVIATTRQLRDAANLDTYVDRYLAVYRQAIERARSDWDRRAEQQAAHVFLRSLVTWVRLGEETWLKSDDPAIDAAANGRPDRTLNAPLLTAEAERQLASIEGPAGE